MDPRLEKVMELATDIGQAGERLADLMATGTTPERLILAAGDIHAAADELFAHVIRHADYLAKEDS